MNGFQTIAKFLKLALLYAATLSRHYSIAKIKTNRADFIFLLFLCSQLKDHHDISFQSKKF